MKLMRGSSFEKVTGASDDRRSSVWVEKFLLMSMVSFPTKQARAEFEDHVTALVKERLLPRKPTFLGTIAGASADLNFQLWFSQSMLQHVFVPLFRRMEGLKLEVQEKLGVTMTPYEFSLAFAENQEVEDLLPIKYIARLYSRSVDGNVNGVKEQLDGLRSLGVLNGATFQNLLPVLCEDSVQPFVSLIEIMVARACERMTTSRLSNQGHEFFDASDKIHNPVRTQQMEDTWAKSFAARLRGPTN